MAKTAKNKAPASAAGTKRTQVIEKDKRRRNIQSVILFALGLMILAFSAIGNVHSEEPNAWDYIHGFFGGVFGAGSLFIGPILIYAAIMISLEKGKSAVSARIFQTIIFIFLFCAALQIIFVGEIPIPEDDESENVLSKLYESGTYFSGGGICSLIIAYPLLLLGRAGATVAIILILFVIIMIKANLSLMDFLRLLAKPFVKLGSFIKKKRAQYEEESQILKEEREKREEKAAYQAAAQAPHEEITEQKLAEKFDRIDALTEKMKEEKIPEKSAEQLETKAIVDEQKQASDEYLTKIGAKSSLTPPRLTDEDYNRAAQSNLTENKNDSGQISEAPQPTEDKSLETAREIPEKSEEIKQVEQAIDEYHRELEEKTNTSAIILEKPDSASNEASQKQEEALRSVEEYVLPPVILLNEIKRSVTDENAQTEINTNANILVNALKSFGVETKFLEAQRGPSVTRYELQPAPGVKISKITGLVDDISLNLATAGVRIEAPIPNKSAVGIEVPNKQKETVFIREMIDSDTFRNCKSKLGSALGKTISGEVVICDIAEMPHILIAGTTGAGKSVCVNSIIMSILFRSTPDEVRFVMIDPKAVEFMIYNGIGHLLLPVLTDPKKAAGMLSWACTEMDKRYNILSQNNVRDIKSYNRLAETREDLEPMPQIVIFIDELADLMMCSKNDVEASICRLAQKARAAGMHLVVATQRPSVDVITGLIKSNIPSRIALKVASQIDSRTIMDTGGAEKLLGKGDMLYKSVAMAKPVRVQGCWVSDEEVERVTDFIKNKFELKYDEDIIDEIERQAEKVGENSANIDDSIYIDDKLDEAIEVVFANNGASTSSLQRRLHVGFGRAASLIDTMEQMGIVGPPDGNKPRQLLMSKESWYERKLNQQD